jgi:hypothetical protein
MSNTASSNGPGMGNNPSAANQRSGLGMRWSVAANLTARIVRLENATAFRTSDPPFVAATGGTAARASRGAAPSPRQARLLGKDATTAPPAAEYEACSPDRFPQPTGAAWRRILR